MVLAPREQTDFLEGRNLEPIPDSQIKSWMLFIRNSEEKKGEVGGSSNYVLTEAQGVI